MNPRWPNLIALLGGIALAVLTILRSRSRSRPAQEASLQQAHAPATRVIVVEQPSVQPKRTGWKRWLLRLGAAGALLGIGGFLVAASGIIPIKASSGHWAVTQWFLQFSKSRSVATHTIGVKPPELDNPAMVLKGAGHYETGCAPCHGSPQRPQPRVAAYMLPRPPGLKQISSRRDDAELFYFVKHGIKLTGMPAWPAPHRDDEVWAMVAFLRALPGMDAGEYRRLAGGAMPLGEGEAIRDLQPPQKAPRAVVESCARCHGADGLGRGKGAFPKLAGQTPEYLHTSLEAYARGERHSGIMGPIAAGLAPGASEELAAYYAGLRPQRAVPVPAATNAEAMARGRDIALNGIPQRRVPACVECHGPREGPRNPHYPVLAGQDADYLVLQLELFSKQQRGGTRYSHLMHFVAGHLTAAQRRDVAVFFASLAGDAETLTGAK